MSKLTDQLNALGMHNAWEFAGHGNVFISFTPTDSGRGGRSAHYSVIRPGYKTDPEKSHWRDNGNKTETVGFDKDKAQVLAELKAWAGQRYKISEWARTPFGTWMDAKFVEKRMAELTAKLKETGIADAPVELPVYHGAIVHDGKQRHVIMAGTKSRFMLATGISSEYVGGPTGNEEDCKAARAKPNALLVNIGGEYKDRSFVEIPEEKWSWSWRDHLAKRARSITAAQFRLLREIVLNKFQPDP